ncbi:MAG: beta-ketoacyl-ACP synthase II [Chloroflexi bacterium]|nr:beta-ketoacyl-ACP synthase II [Chloroflexota bacterium]
MKTDKSRVVVTGMGAVTPLGIGIEETWKALLEGRSGIRRITRFDVSSFPTQFAGEVMNFDPKDYMDFREAKRTARFTQFAVVATQQAIQDAALDLSKEDATRIGLEIGTAIGGIDLIEEQSIVFHQKGPGRINPTLVPVVIANAAPCHIAISLGIKGPTSSPVAACATGTVAIGEALRKLQKGEAEVMIAGGTEAANSPLALAAFSRLGALSTRNTDPEKACRPFDAQRDGTVMGEGAAVLVLETLEHAKQRGANILAEVLGYALTEDAYHIAAPDPTGDGAARAMALALADAGIAPDEVDYIVPHGTGTPLNDVSETRACKIVFGERAYRIPISSNKSMMGHLLGAAGAISTVIAILAIRDGIVPPTINLEYPDPECDLDYVPNQARRVRVDTAIANAFGFGGQNATVVVRRAD